MEEFEEPVAFIGKLANVYQPPAYHTSNLIRRLHFQNEPIRPKDRTILDFYGELESMRLRYAPDPRIPHKHDLYELSLHELWGHGDSKSRKNGTYNPYEPSSSSEAFTTGKSLGPNVLANPIEAVAAEPLFLQALRVFEIQPRIAHFMLCSKKANVLQEYCWPVCSRQDELSIMMDLKQKKGFFRNKFDTNRIGDTSIDRFLMLSNEVKSYKPRVSDGQLVWSENFHIVPRHRAFERNIRQPPTVLIEMARSNLHRQVRNDGVIIVPRPKRIFDDGAHRNGNEYKRAPVISGKDILHASYDAISLAGMTTRPAPGLKPKDIEHPIAHRIAHERQLGPNSFARAPHIKESLQEQAFELALARYFEATLDALLEAVFQFILPILRIAAEDPNNVSTESSGTFKLSNNRANNSNKHNIEVDEQKELLDTLAKSTVIAIESVRFYGKKNQPKSSLKQHTAKIESNPNSSQSNRHWRKRKFKVACRHDRLAINKLQPSEQLNSLASLRVKRRQLDVTVELPEHDKAQFDQRVTAWRRPKSISALRQLYLALKHDKETRSIAEKDDTVESINDNSTIIVTDRRRKRKRSQAADSPGQQLSKKRRKQGEEERTELDETQEEQVDTEDEDEEEEEEQEEEEENGNESHNKKLKKRSKKHIPESIPLPVSLSKVYLPRSWAFRKHLGMHMLRWQKGGVIGSGRRKKLSIRMLHASSPSHAATTATAGGVIRKDPDDDMSAISAITGDDLDVLEKSSIASFALSTDNEDSSAQGSSKQTPKASSQAMKLHLSAPSVAGTLETSFRHQQPAIDPKTGEFQLISAATVDNPSSSLSSNQEKQNVHWEHVLTILELIRDICAVKTGDVEAETVVVKIHPDLPGIPLTMQTLKRIRYRLVALFTNFLREEDAQHVPHVAIAEETTTMGSSRHLQQTSFLTSVPSLLRQPAKYPKYRPQRDTTSTASVLPPAFLVSDTLAEDSRRCLSQMYMQTQQQRSIANNNKSNNNNNNNVNNDEDHQPNNKTNKRVRFTVTHGQGPPTLPGYGDGSSEKIWEKAAVQALYGYGGVTTADLMLSAGDTPLLGETQGDVEVANEYNNDKDENEEDEEEENKDSGLRRNHHLFPRTVVLNAQKISVRYKQHLARLYKRYPQLREQLMSPTESEKKANPYITTLDTDDDDLESDRRHHHHAASAASSTSRKYSPFPLLSSPMKLRPSVSQSSFTSTKAAASKKDTDASSSPLFEVTQSCHLSLSPVASVMGSVHDYDTFPVPSAYVSSPLGVMGASRPTTHVSPTVSQASPGPVSSRVTTRRGRHTITTAANRTQRERHAQQESETAQQDSSFDFYAIDSADL